MVAELQRQGRLKVNGQWIGVLNHQMMGQYCRTGQIETSKWKHFNPQDC